MKHFIVVLILKCSINLVLGQNKALNNISLSGHLFDLVDPGLQVGIQGSIKSWEKTKLSRKGPKVKEKFFLGGLQLGYYHEMYSHHGITIIPELEWRRVKPTTGKLFRASIGLGFQQSIYDAKVYTVSTDGEVSQNGSSSQSLMVSSLSIGWGRDLRYRKEIPLAWTLGVGASGRFPVNKTFIPMPFIHASMIYYLKFEKDHQ